MSEEHQPIPGLSYAAVASHNADQSPEEARAPPVPEIAHEEPERATIDVDSGVSVVPNDFLEHEIKTDTQAIRIELEEEAAEAAEQRRAEEHLAAVAAKKKAAKKYTGSGSAGGRSAEEVVALVNSVLGGVAAVVLGVGAYRKWNVGQLTWRTAGIWLGGAAAVGGVDFLLSRFYLQKRAAAK